MSFCTHPTARDHMAAFGNKKRRPIWRCSKCGAMSVWREGWRYFGNVECKHCGQAAVDRVACPKCAPKVTA